MGWLDIVLIVVIALSAFFGLRTGLIKAVLTLTGMIIGIILAGRLSPVLAEQLTFISDENIAKIIAFAVIFVTILLIALILSSVLKWIAKIMLLNWVNHIGGAVFGLIMGSIFCGALLVMWIMWVGPSETITESIVAAFLIDQLPLVMALLPEEFDSVRSFFY